MLKKWFIPLRPSRIRPSRLRPSRLRPSAPRPITQIILVKTGKVDFGYSTSITHVKYFEE